MYTQLQPTNKIIPSAYIMYFILVAFFIHPHVYAEIINVPEDYVTIQAAIDAAAITGDEIIVAPGTYNQAIDFIGKAIYLHSMSGV